MSISMIELSVQEKANSFISSTLIVELLIQAQELLAVGFYVKMVKLNN